LHLSSLPDSLLITIKPKDKYGFCMTAMFVVLHSTKQKLPYQNYFFNIYQYMQFQDPVFVSFYGASVLSPHKFMTTTLVLLMIEN
jgi:hypothetical protein